ncbi:MAG: serine hydroxymethyltransferase [Microgenomates group bacterium GW2011_GWC1_46_16]|nr:MAG: Serine hydroxymethyltransferase [Microgenomates group bacterium GW2011_GWF1_46_12]KKU26720.1 MAG: serine hydroxymethyltransferase [Microgenomates group bacterium GW2011_GWC1_46_16]KKU27565.1 MAG: Serine hydroxymethyltransferase [Microgenomates group bacterium GW2011_GWF2_46_18]KKU43604.1 MAG: Serine hydroxymethyltransferase [Microgenomates group bacterium GW2011_GWA1_46_7]KKU45106.1 MAG: Serine hydroxymethyltransferase [Microgenomates group bacterium GW2011_GWB1_46_7]KKU60255.1 MAG: Se
MSKLQQTDPEIYALIQAEEKRQTDELAMIPSENIVSEAVKEAVGSVLMNKYSEGQPGKRYYQGNGNIDAIESLVEQRALQVFGLDSKDWHVNVQPVTGSIANFAVYAALLSPGDRMLAMSLYDGGHLTHGWKLPDGKPISFTSKIYDTYFYNVDPQTEVFDYAQIAKIAAQVKPQILISGGTAYPREIDYAKMREIADSVGAIYMADVAHEAGLIAGGANTSPFPHAHVVTMTTRKTLRGPIGAMIFASKKLLGDSVAEKIDFAVFPALQGGPQNHSIAGIGVALHEALQPEFKTYAQQVVKNAQVLAAELKKAGFHVVSGGTDKHLILLDLRNKGISGKDAALALEKVGIITNKNTVPGETGKPWNPSGLRLGTPAVTTRGYTEKDMLEVAKKIIATLSPSN